MRKSSSGLDLPLRVPLIAGETTASYLARTAAANGLAYTAMLRALQPGRRGRLPPLRPVAAEVYLSRESVRLLAELVHRPVDQVVRALPNLRDEHLLASEQPRVRSSAWPSGFGQAPLPACPVCMEGGAWLVSLGRRWTPCGCGRRWMVGDRGGYLVDVTPVPQLGRAWRRHKVLVHRLGPVGDALVADAHQVALWWWVHRRQVGGTTWRHREDALGMPKGRRLTAPVVVYPEAVALAEAMWSWEQRRHRPGADAQVWLEEVAEQLGAPQVAVGRGLRREGAPLAYWLAHHTVAEPVGRGRAGEGGPGGVEARWARLPEGHRRPAESGLFQAGSCLSWVYGRPLTSVEVCPRCGGRAPSCRWVPSPACTGL
ncbi:TniQ family protein [Streptomyces sp. RPT161]|uniref:TniQ family protein n=1 Tax=Streptomyces sp. RPT161 TaxID=3015993 RepID=UPI0022B8862F|nr:TniQ family protein [Streptomyces sp. RPT161]